MFKRFFVVMALSAAIFLMSCSDSESTKPKLNSSEALQSEMSSVMTNVIATPGATALTNNMEAMNYLPFGLPVKNISGSLNRINSVESIAKNDILKKIFPVSETTAKQEDHFIFSNWLGTYTLDNVTYAVDDYTGETYIASATWTRDYTNTTNIIIIIPSQYTDNGEEFRLVLNNYVDEYISWYDSDQYYYYDYFPTLIDMEVYSAGTKVLDLDFNADWQYMTAMDDVMPVYLTVVLELTPYVLNVTYTNTVANVLNYSMALTENQNTLMSFDAVITFTDGTLEEVSEIDLGYGFGDYYIDFWADVVGMDTFMGSETLTIDEAVAGLNSGDYVYCYIYENDVQIGQLKAEKVWDEYEWNEETQDYTGNWVIVPYVEFNDGSKLGEEELYALVGNIGVGK